MREKGGTKDAHQDETIFRHASRFGEQFGSLKGGGGVQNEGGRGEGTE